MAEVAAPSGYGYGMVCPWFGPLSDAMQTAGQLCCPGCGGALYKCDDADQFWNAIRQNDVAAPGLLAFMQWVDAEIRTGRHFRTIHSAASAYRSETGNSTDWAVAATVYEYKTVPILGMVTFVDRDKVRPTRVRGKDVWGWTYRKAGFEEVGETKGGLLVLQLLPEKMPYPVAANQRSLHGLDLFRGLAHAS